jgi:basic membrane protein A
MKIQQRRLREVGLFGLILLGLMALGACGGTPTEPAGQGATGQLLQVAYIYNGPIGDLGWIYSHEQGRQYLEDTLPGVETTYIEDVAEGPDAERVIRNFAARGYDLIFTTTHGFGDATLLTARDFPDIAFEHATGTETAANVSTYFGRMYQARFLSGLVAGSMTESNIIGYVAAFPIPQVVRGINGFARGVQAANPDAVVQVVWTRSWFDPALEREATEALINIGADVITQHQNSAEPMKVAEDYWGGLEDGIIDLAPYHEAVPQAVIDLVDEWRARIIDTEWDVFTGPLYAQDGTLLLAEGETFDDNYLYNEMDWFVQGVVGEADSPPPAAK